MNILTRTTRLRSLKNAESSPRYGEGGFRGNLSQQREDSIYYNIIHYSQAGGGIIFFSFKETKEARGTYRWIQMDT